MPDGPEIPYFVCTLGDAEDSSIQQPFRNVNQLIERQATQFANSPAVGFYRTQNTKGTVSFKHEVLTFQQLRRAISTSALILSSALSIAEGSTVGLLCSSSPEFLLTWLACIWLGYPVLLIAPQCAPDGIRRLCEDVGVSALLVDKKHFELASKALHNERTGAKSGLSPLTMPLNAKDIFRDAASSESEVLEPARLKSTSVAYYHHTSGTSSGVPKPIPQSHHGAVGALPALDGTSTATFTTTPLYHGGPADIFRAWASGAMIWLFPSNEVPITASNIVQCLECALGTEQRNLSAPVKYFASVPYVLQMMAEDTLSLEWLAKMDLVGVGGAALPAQIGDQLVENSVNLVSRFGSAECGFLLSSRRFYQDDKEWQYLRPSRLDSQLKFEVTENGLSELIVLSTWPHIAKRNRDDGSFATSDLFERHPHIQNAWKYHSRADALLTLVTGKKFDPEPFENAIVAASKDISDVLVFGKDRAYPGALLFRSEEARSTSDEEVIQAAYPIVSKLNQGTEPHARISANMLLPVPYCEQPLPKSSKGTVIRNTAEEMYADSIDGTYQAVEQVSRKACSDDKVPEIVTEIVRNALVTNDELSEDLDFFSLGVDSLVAMRIRHKLRQLLPESAPRLSISVVEDTGNISRLSDHLVALRHGRDVDAKHLAKSDQLEQMKKLVDSYSKFREPASTLANAQERDGEVIVLTGATGALGAHVLHQLRQNHQVTRIYCLVRGADSHAAHERVNKALLQRKLDSLEFCHGRAEVVVLQAALGKRDLGLSDEMYVQIAQEATVIMHLAWSVNFRMKLQSFVKDSIASVNNLINLALTSSRSSCPDFVFCSSVASAMAYSGSEVGEELLDNPSTATDLGYSQSKWVAEHICQRASKLPSLQGKMSVFRVGQLSGDSKHGIWNTKEAWPLMLSTASVTETLPDLGKEPLDWLPIDIAAAAMIEGSLTEDLKLGKALRVYHLLNDAASTTWADLLYWTSKRSSFEKVPPHEWLRRLEEMAAFGSNHPALQLLDHWRRAYGGPEAKTVERPRPKFETVVGRDALPSMNAVKAVDETYFARLWDWIQENM